VVAARQIRSQLDLPCSFFVGDCRWLPFPDSTFTDVFSYSVVQHFSKSNAQVSIAEFQRVLNANGICLVQMPNVFGIRSFYHLARRRFSEGSKFDVRYYTPNELRNIFEAVFGNAALSVDGFFGLGIQVDDLRFMPWKNRVIINASEVLRSLANKLPMLVKLADSLYVTSVKERAPANTH
jgi:SAM-dependent methyltransferase